MFFKCEICGSIFDVGDTTNNICLCCIDNFSETLLHFFKLEKSFYSSYMVMKSMFDYHLQKELKEIKSKSKGMNIKQHVK